MTEEQRIARGQHYEQFRDAIAAVFDGVRQVILEEIENASPGRADDILEMHRGLQNLAKVRHAISLVIADGNAAAATNIARLHRAA